MSHTTRLCHFGTQLLEKGEFRLALEQFEEILRTDPCHASALLGKGRALFYLKRYSDALRSFERAATHQVTSDISSNIWHARTLLKLKLPQRALGYCKQVLSSHPWHFRSHILQAQCLWKLGYYWQWVRSLISGKTDKSEDYAIIETPVPTVSSELV